MSTQYAKGARAWGICGRSGKRALLRDLVFDGRFPNMRVLPDWWEPPDPKPISLKDPVALWRPAPEDGPIPPALSGRRGGGTIRLTWSEGDPHGHGRFETYTLYRSVSQDEGVTFSDYTVVFTGVVEYDIFMAILDLPDTFEDDGIDTGLLYRYFVVAADANGRGVNSNIVQPEDHVTLDELVSTGVVLVGTLEEAQFLTSKIYPIEIIEALESSGSARNVDQYMQTEALDISGVPVEGELQTVLLEYTDGAPEALDVAGTLLEGTLETLLVAYEDAAPEALSMAGTVLEGTLESILQTYAMRAEALDITGTVLSGTLT